MKGTIAIFNSGTGEIHGFRDFNQAQVFLGIERRGLLVELLAQGGGYHEGMYVSSLIMHKSNRGGRRS